MQGIIGCNHEEEAVVTMPTKHSEQNEDLPSDLQEAFLYKFTSSFKSKIQDYNSIIKKNSK